MPGRDVPAASAALTVDGTADGYVTVGDNSAFYKGAQAFLNAAGEDPVEVVITEIASGGKVGLRKKNRPGVDDIQGLPQPRYGNDDMSAYTVAGGWSLLMPAQFNYSAA